MTTGACVHRWVNTEHFGVIVRRFCERCGIAADKPRHRSDDCDIVRNGDQFLCRFHYRYWQTGICPGLR